MEGKVRRVLEMGRTPIEVDLGVLADMIGDGLTQEDQASELGLSLPTLRRRIGSIEKSEKVILKYRSVQALQLTALQARILEAITPEKIDDAPLRDLVGAFKILKDRELIMEGKPSEIKGLVGYLIELEKEEFESRQVTKKEMDEFEDAEFSEVEEKKELPKL